MSRLMFFVWHDGRGHGRHLGAMQVSRNSLHGAVAGCSGLVITERRRVPLNSGLVEKIRLHAWSGAGLVGVVCVGTRDVGLCGLISVLQRCVLAGAAGKCCLCGHKLRASFAGMRMSLPHVLPMLSRWL